MVGGRAELERQPLINKADAVYAHWLWRSMSLVCAYGLVLGGLYADVLSDLVRDWWQDPDYSHGFLVPLLAVYSLWP